MTLLQFILATLSLVLFSLVIGAFAFTFSAHPVKPLCDRDLPAFGLAVKRHTIAGTTAGVLSIVLMGTLGVLIGTVGDFFADSTFITVLYFITIPVFIYQLMRQVSWGNGHKIHRVPHRQHAYEMVAVYFVHLISGFYILTSLV